jgi:hypothetical protein
MTNDWIQCTLGPKVDNSIFPSCQVGNKLVGGDAKSAGRWYWTEILGIGPLGVLNRFWISVGRMDGIGGKK